MIVDHPLWEEKPMTEEFKDWYRKTYGLEAEKLILAKPEYYEMMAKIMGARGGKATLKKYGREHFSRIGRKK